MLSIPALLLTAAWVVVVSVILALFGRTAGGAWSIAGGVARGVRSWAAQRAEPPRVASSSAWSTSSAPSASATPSASAASSAELEDL